MTDDETKRLVEKAASELGEHFDSVRIFVTWQAEDNQSITRSLDISYGNWFASFGQVLEWVEIQRGKTRMSANPESGNVL